MPSILYLQEVEALRRQLREEGEAQVGQGGNQGHSVGELSCALWGGRRRALLLHEQGCKVALPNHQPCRQCRTQVARLEGQCGAQAAALREARREHEEALASLAQQHAARVAQLEAGLAAAERSAEELRGVTAQLGSVRQEDVEALKVKACFGEGEGEMGEGGRRVTWRAKGLLLAGASGRSLSIICPPTLAPWCPHHRKPKQAAVQELQLRPREAVRERERQARAHAAQLAALGGQVRAKLAVLRASQLGGTAGAASLFLQPTSPGKQERSDDVAASCAECLASYESALAAAQQQLERQVSAAERQQAELAAQAGRMQGALQQLLGALAAEVPGLQAAVVQETILECSSGGSSSGQQQVKAAVQQVAAAVQQHVERAEAAAIDSALAALEGELLPGGQRGAAPSPCRLLSPSKRQEGGAAAVAAAPAPPSHEANEARLAALLGRSRELLGQLAAGEAAAAQLRQRVAAAEATAASYSGRFEAAKAEGLHAAEAARAAAVAPLQAEVSRLTERVIALQQQHATEVAAIEAAARRQADAAQGEAQAVVDRLSAAGRDLERELRGESARAEGLAADLVRVQGELAKHTQRAATTVEVQQRELALLRERIR